MNAPRLVGLTAIVVALAAAVAITGDRRDLEERPLVAPGLVAGNLSRITIARRGEPDIVIELSEHGARVAAPVPGPADEAVVRDLISALATARADRVAGAASVGTPDVIVSLAGDGIELTIGRGARVPASGQVWLGVRGQALLVPAWVGDALGRDLMALRRRRPFPPAPITGVEIHGGGVDLVLSGDPLRRRDDGAGVRIAAAARARLEAALAAVVLDVLVTGDAGTPGLTVRILGAASVAELTVTGPCPGVADHVLVTSSAGLGCIPTASADAITAAARVLAGPDGLLLAPREGAVSSIDLPAPRLGGSGLARGNRMDSSPHLGGAPDAPSEPVAGESRGAPLLRLSRRGAGWILGPSEPADALPPVDADDAAVAALFEALARPGTLATLPAGAPEAVWTVTLDGGAVETWAWWWRRGPGNGARFRRDAEPHALAVDAVTADAARTAAMSLRDRTALSLEPTAIAAIAATGALPATLERGALVGEWQVTRPAGATAALAANALVDAVAQLRGTAWLAPAALGAVRRTVTLTLDAPPVAGATATTHVIAVGAARGGGTCAARIDALPPLALDATTCAALLAPLTN